MAHLRRHVDDDASAAVRATGRGHQPRAFLRGAEEGADIEGDQAVERRLVDFEERLRPVDPGVVDEDVDAADPGERGFERGDSVELGGGAAVEDEARAGGGEGQGDRPAQPAPGAGDERGLAVEPEGIRQCVP